MLCFIISLLFCYISFSAKEVVARKQFRVSLGFLATSLVLLVLWRVSDGLRGRLFRHTRRAQFRPVLTTTPPADVRRAVRERVLRGDGSALVLLLILLGLMTGLVLQIQLAARRQVQRAERALLQTRLHQAAAEGAHAALQRLAEDDDLLADHLREAWAVPQVVTNPAGLVVRVSVLDENRFFDWNNLAILLTGPAARSAAEMAMDILTLCGDFAPIAKVEALSDWVNASAPGLAQTPYYRQREPPYEAAKRPLYAWSELLWVRGFSRGMFTRRERQALTPGTADLVDCFTVVPVSRNHPVRININTASREVLLGVFGLERGAAVQTILALREGGPIRSLRPAERLVEPRLRDVLDRYLDVKSLYFRIAAEAAAGEQTGRILVLARRSDQGGLEIVQWVFQDASRVGHPPTPAALGVRRGPRPRPAGAGESRSRRPQLPVHNAVPGNRRTRRTPTGRPRGRAAPRSGPGPRRVRRRAARAGRFRALAGNAAELGSQGAQGAAVAA
ncbi:MAG: type II secretion system protein GspK [Kiritimatiellaeota bacterium]|nr:type II secretion system protein GspK [Kiritimatiellota bacterium]